MALTIKRPERPVTVCLDGTLTAEWELTKAQLDKLAQEMRLAERAVKREPNDDRPNRRKTPAEKHLAELEQQAQDLAARAQELSEAAEASTVTFRLRALPRATWDALVTEHPARPGIDGGESPDAPFPFNRDEIADAVLTQDEAIVEVTHADGTVEDFTGQDWPEFAVQLTESQHVEFRTAVVQLNVGSNELPFYRASGTTGGSVKK